MPRQRSASRFVIRTAEGAETIKKAETPGAVLSQALNYACQSLEPGVWEVVEWDDVLYRVHRLEGKLDVRVEIVRA